MIKICMLGAVDRFNYGDLLLPIIVKEKLKSYDEAKELIILNYGVINSDLSKYGALPSKSLREFYRDCKKLNSSVIIVGGEVLNAEWGNIYSYVNPLFNKLYIFNNIFFRRYGMVVNSIMAKFFLSGKTNRPFVLDKRKLDISNKLIYNGVGGNRVVVRTKKETEFLSLLEKSNVDYISVRDEGIYKKIIKKSVNCFLTPDSAILMSTIYQNDDLHELSNLSKELICDDEFIFFQISKRELDLYTPKKIVEKLIAIYKEYGFRIILCPIGTALGHEDDVALDQINSLLDDSVLKTFIKAPSIWDIMYLISKCRLYIGSSLHGVITAMSYSRPYIAIRESTKIKFYLETWAPEELGQTTLFESWEENVAKALEVDIEKLKRSREKQIEISERSMRDIYKILLGSN